MSYPQDINDANQIDVESQQNNRYDKDDRSTISNLGHIIDRILSNRPAPTSSLGNPGPLGLGGFAMTTFLLSCWNANLLSATTEVATVLPLAFWYGGLTQLFAGLFEIAANNTFGATAFCSYGAFWLAFSTLLQFGVPEYEAAGNDAALINPQIVAMFLLAWTIFTFYMWIGSFRTSWCLVAVFSTLILAFICLTAGAFASTTTAGMHATYAGGWIGIICAFCAWYSSAAVVINSTWGIQLLPVGVIGPIQRNVQIQKSA